MAYGAASRSKNIHKSVIWYAAEVQSAPVAIYKATTVEALADDLTALLFGGSRL